MYTNIDLKLRNNYMHMYYKLRRFSCVFNGHVFYNLL